MNSDTLFGMALGLTSPWQVDSIDFSGTEGRQELHIRISFARGSRFADQSGEPCPVHDTVERRWQHLNFFEHTCYLHCRVPRIRTGSGQVETVAVPWARPGSGFTLLFEALAMALIEREMPVNRVAELMRVNPQRIWTVFNHWVCEGRQQDDPSGITRLGVDETSTRKGHNYITVGVDLDARRVAHATEGKGKETLSQIQKHLASHEVKPSQITDVSIDLSPAFIAGSREAFPDAAITFDHFHVTQLLNKAMDKVRKLERKEHADLKGHKYTFLKNYDNLSEQQEQSLAAFITLYPTLGTAHRLKVLFNDLWTMPDRKTAEAFLQQWCDEVDSAGIPAFQTFANTVRAHWSGIIRFVESHISNGILEGINHKIQLAKRRARGFRNTHNLINMVYFLCGKLEFSYPRYST
ncbi:LOW QUALITY PROTEIN: transposase IS204/IS1001/IS1096/IS1165 family protein [Thiothrix nivea DSM 5205]|uniref:Transposase IS204/IS1001/IS1096/IS1165 family protein n=1 Tax=Thiothrix nivea (strain ATCC 35100 / DSM 5205 / JP2) TaxID=870187 RepID=A0A656HPQ8_THINJ|nr:LOW QUALITY PROTEIN: transposase IS204/IS1001/IS1096/IS1165 family protein [Thiothrix nivea DSM 5205]EIJ37055.1 LOW QUALITY PROTEIN: transposase IS204/IS1001/IS1096/IS1165 family protein [Thiothrix nivea DSM 5205]